MKPVWYNGTIQEAVGEIRRENKIMIVLIVNEETNTNEYLENFALKFHKYLEHCLNVHLLFDGPELALFRLLYNKELSSPSMCIMNQGGLLQVCSLPYQITEFEALDIAAVLRRYVEQIILAKEREEMERKEEHERQIRRERLLKLQEEERKRKEAIHNSLHNSPQSNETTQQKEQKEQNNESEMKEKKMEIVEEKETAEERRRKHHDQQMKLFQLRKKQLEMEEEERRKRQQQLEEDRLKELAEMKKEKEEKDKQKAFAMKEAQELKRQKQLENQQVERRREYLREKQEETKKKKDDVMKKERILVAVRLPQGGRVSNYFSKNDQLKDVYTFVENSGVKGFLLVDPRNQQEIVSLESTLDELKFWPSIMLAATIRQKTDPKYYSN